MNVKISLPDGSVREYPRGVKGSEIASSISEGLARVSLAIEVNGEVRDLARPITEDASIKILTWNDKSGKSAFWHSSAHLMAEALETLYPGVKFGIGPPIDNGFYYDVDLGDRPFGDDDLAAVENKMKELAKRDSVYSRRDVSKAEALDYFTKKDDPYKIELINGLEDGKITFYQQGDFVDLCKGPHIPHTGFIKAVKLLNVAGAYWRGNEKNKMLTRLYGITFPKQKELDEYLHLLEEAKKRDHRKLGKELELFGFSEKVGMGLPLWLPKGTILRERLEQFMRRAQIKADMTLWLHLISGEKHCMSLRGITKNMARTLSNPSIHQMRVKNSC